MTTIFWIPLIVVLIISTGSIVVWTLWQTRVEQFFALNKSQTLKNNVYDVDMFTASEYFTLNQLPRDVEEMRTVWCYDGTIKDSSNVMVGSEKQIATIYEVLRLWWNMNTKNAFAI